ncbi:ABC transporter substrate-binding protein [Agromyces sp. MMS24-JH15]|uniref:ABC transporter substrate-binding protein n=1 Tax=Agromyces sp. MMS24-JH15 TaxID=3243765 RepID=UPI0037486E26
MSYSRSIRHRGLVAVAAIGLVALTGCATAAATPDPSAAPVGLDGESAEVRAQLTELYAAARSAGEVSVGVDTPNAAAFDQPDARGFGRVVAQFEETFPGIDVVPVDVSSTPLAEKIAAEEKTGSRVSDVALSSIPELFDLQGDERLADFAPANADALIDQDNFRDPRGQAYEIAQGYTGLSFHSSTLDADSVPTTFAELASPEWKDRFALLGPAQSQVQGFLAAALYAADTGVEEFDDATFRAVAANAVISNNQSTYAADVASGKHELSLFGPAVLTLTLKDQGQEIDFADSEATRANSVWVSVLDQAPNENAARLFAAFLLSSTAQETISSGTYFNPTIEGVPVNPLLAGIAKPVQIPFDQVVEYIARAKELAPTLYPAGAADAD